MKSGRSEVDPIGVVMSPRKSTSFFSRAHTRHCFVSSEDYILNVMAETRLDHAILQVLREAGPRGALPSKISYQLRTYGVDRFKVTRLIKAINRRLQRELGYDATEKVGHRWAPTDFMTDVWGIEKQNIERHGIRQSRKRPERCACCV